MENEFEKTADPSGAEPVCSLRDLDEETIAILVDDKIATGG